MIKERCRRKQSKGERDSSSSLLGDMKYTIKDSLLYRALSKNEICERYLFIYRYLFLRGIIGMLTKEDLLSCTVAPNINEVSLELYRDFSETYLIPRKFHYEFLDGTAIDLVFTEWGIYHMLSIHHIDRRVRKANFFAQISKGLSFDTFKSEAGKNRRFKREKKRITMFACVYNTLLTGTMFYLPSSHVRNTAEVEMDYIAFRKLRNVSPTGITYNGINVGIRQCGDVYVPLTILISTNSNVVEYIKDEELKIVKRMYISDEDGHIIEERSYEAVLVDENKMLSEK